MTESLSDSGPHLADFQNAFAQALSSDAAYGPLAALVAQPGFAVYRNTVMKGCIDALQANHPAVTRLVGEQWLRAAAAVFVRGQLPRQPSLVDYGAGFADFLAQFPPAAEVPYLADVARLDRFWTEAHVAPDAGRCSAAAIAALDYDVLAASALRPHPSARWRWFVAAPIYSIWRGNRDGAAPEALSAIPWRGEGALVVRPDSTVEAIGIDAADCAFLDACSRGSALADAGLAALAVDANTDLAELLARLLQAGAFTAIDVITIHTQETP